MDNNSYFNKKANTYDQEDQKLFWKFTDEILLHYIDRLLSHCNPHLRILDAGCGTGKWTSYLDKKFPFSKIEAIDINNQMLSIAHEKAFSKNVRFSIEDMKETSYEDNTFDLILAIHSIPFSCSIEKTINELSRVLKKGGLVICTLFNGLDTLALNNLTNSIDNTTNQRHA